MNSSVGIRDVVLDFHYSLVIEQICIQNFAVITSSYLQECVFLLVDSFLECGISSSRCSSSP